MSDQEILNGKCQVILKQPDFEPNAQISSGGSQCHFCGGLLFGDEEFTHMCLDPVDE